MNTNFSLVTLRLRVSARPFFSRVTDEPGLGEMTKLKIRVIRLDPYPKKGNTGLFRQTARACETGSGFTKGVGWTAGWLRKITFFAQSISFGKIGHLC